MGQKISLHGPKFMTKEPILPVILLGESFAAKANSCWL